MNLQKIKVSSGENVKQEEHVVEVQKALQETQRELNSLINSDAWKIAVVLGKIKFPFKNKIKKLLVRVIESK